MVFPLFQSASELGQLSLLKWNSQSIFPLEAWISKCTPQRLRKAERYKNEADRMRCLATGALLGDLVRSLTGESLSDEVALASGKPILPDFPDIEISISHSGDWVACAVARSPIGIDLEYDDDLFFKAEAWPPGCRHWTNCEAYLKFHGWGLSVMPQSLVIERAAGNIFHVDSRLLQNQPNAQPNDQVSGSGTTPFGFDLAVDERHWLSVYGSFLPFELGVHRASPIL